MRKHDSIYLSETQQRAVMKLAVELVKADDRIHSKEVNVLDGLQCRLGLKREGLDLIHYLSLEDAVRCLRELDETTTGKILTLFSEIMRADDDIDFEENLLLSSISLSCGTDSRDWCQILSINAPEAEIPRRQVVFLEKEISDATRQVLDDRYDNLLISKAFSDIGFELFYLPDILAEFNRLLADSDKADLLKRAMEYLVPTGDKAKLNDIGKSLASLDTKTFFHIIVSRFNISPERLPYKSSLLIKIRDSHVLDDSDTMRRMVDLLCIDISSEVKRRILSFVSKFDERRDLLSYKGYYKFLYDYLSSESKVSNPIHINSKGDFILESGDVIRFESAPQAKTLYMLLLRHGKRGISQSVFKQAIDFLSQMDSKDYLSSSSNFCLSLLQNELSRINDEYANVIHDTITIYETLSTKDIQSESYPCYIQRILMHRSSLKTYINSAFASVPRLANPELFMVRFNPDIKAYSVSASPSMFISSLDCDSPRPLVETSLWKSLK